MSDRGITLGDVRAGAVLPEAAAVKLAAPPVVTIWVDGWVATAGRSTAAKLLRQAMP